MDPEKSNYRAKGDDHLARFFCEERGWLCEIVPTGKNGECRIRCENTEGKVFTREVSWKYNQGDYALYDTYKSLAGKIQEDERTKNI